MRSTALKQDYFASNANDNAEAPDRGARYRQIALQAEAAAHLSGNANGPDFEEFLLKYSSSASDFA